ncbi:hypothetical protein GF377_05165 [candidate division GN15 bacterium]|nr:hypothetical protein [candidate division GN15 bacterium]
MSSILKCAGAAMVCLLVLAGNVMAQGSITGTVDNSDASTPSDGDIEFFGFLDDTDEEIKIKRCVGTGYDNGNWFDDFQNYQTEAAGNPYDYYFYNATNGEGYHLADVIPSNSFEERNITLAPVNWPDTPTGLHAVTQGNGDITLHWDNAPGLTWHVYRRAATSSGSFFRIDDPGGSLANPGVGTNTYTDTNTDGVSSYTYLVIAEDGAGSLSPHSRTTTISSTFGAFDDSEWELMYQENFDSSFAGQHGQTFGQDGWLKFQLINGGAITIENGYAQLNAPEFWHAALIRSTDILPSEYKLRTKIGDIDYDLTNYDSADFANPDFNDHNGHPENGVYFLTVTNDTCAGNQCAELWWHYHRKMVIDVDNHIDWNVQLTETYHPTYMVYMAPETNSGGNLLRTWTGSFWDTSPWNWNVAYTYDYGTWYYAELEKVDGHIILRLYDGNRNLIEETTPVNLNLVHAMDDSTEYLYVGEPHTDDYEGRVRIDEITLLVPSSEGCCTGPSVGNMDGSPDNEVTLGDLTVIIDHLFITLDPLPPCP